MSNRLKVNQVINISLYKTLFELFVLRFKITRFRINMIYHLNLGSQRNEQNKKRIDDLKKDFFKGVEVDKIKVRPFN